MLPPKVSDSQKTAVNCMKFDRSNKFDLGIMGK